MSKRVITGTCKLTGLTGRFVRSHLLPKALTRLVESGSGRIEAGDGRRPTRRFDGWYDDHLVVTRGEQILAILDDWAVKALRLHKMVWSGFVPGEPLPGLAARDIGGARMITGLDGERLRMFLLSLLWRAAATEREEFRPIVLTAEDLATIADALVSGSLPPATFYPITLTQLTSQGDPHNWTPIASVMRGMPGSPWDGKAINTFRFYLDGLIAHVYPPGKNCPSLDDLGPMTVGGDQPLLICALPFEISRQRANMHQVVFEAEARWPGVVQSFKSQ